MHSPTERSQAVPDRLVALLVLLPLESPKISVAFWEARTYWAVVAMPKAAVDKDHLSSGWEYQVRLPGKIPGMKPESVTSAVQVAP
jgi:hypothetical protein